MCYGEQYITCVTANSLLHNYVLLRTIDYNLYTLFEDSTHEQSIISICYSKQLNTICLNHVHCLHGAE